MNQPDPDNAQALQNLADAAAAAPPVHLPLLELPSDVAFNDWDDLFNAVKSRLTLTVGELSALSEPQARGTADRIRASVLECVGALDQLQTTLTNQIARRQQLELEVFEAQTALAL
ncbi:MAG: hypothetical protein KGK18_02205, partial [Burkholderiales bacterium]|nr:hypothetical protein [Burkholderiales bacterium]